MRKATTVKPVMWRKRSFKSLSPDAKFLYLFLLTGPDTNLSGLVSYSVVEMAEFTGMTKSVIKLTMDELVSTKRVIWDIGDDLVLLLRWSKHNPRSNEKQEIGATNCIEAYKHHPFHEITVSLLSGADPDMVSVECLYPIDTSQGQGQGKNEDKSKNQNKIKRKDYKAEATEVLAHLNLTRGTGFTKISNIQACFKREGCTVDDCKLVIDYKQAEWGSDPEKIKWLDITTPWRPSKFSDYLDQAKASKPKEQEWLT